MDMVKIAILTPKNSYNSIKKALENIECIKEYIFYDNLYKLGEIYKKIAHKYHGVVTSGPIGYENIKTHVNITTPIYYLEISKSDLFKYLFETLRENANINFSRVYIDFISNEDKKYWLENIFKEKEEPIFLPLDYRNVKLYENLKKNYLKLKKEKKIDYVLTRISNMLPFLRENNIPYKFLFPSENTIKETILEVIKDIKAQRFEKNQIIFGKLKIRKNLEEIKSIIHNNCKNCILQKNEECLDILLLKKDFVEGNINKIISDKYKEKFYIGWGSGENFNEARYYAEEALKKSKDSCGKVTYMVSPNKTYPLTEIRKKEKEEIEIIKKLTNLNLSRERIRILLEIFKKNKKLDSKILAKYLIVSEKTASRILEKLGKNALAILHLEKIKRGRPKKLYYLDF